VSCPPLELCRQRHPLSAAEQTTLRQYKEDEIHRMQEKHKKEGLAQDERYLLDKLTESLKKEDQVDHELVHP
jgi:hypothetical protein